RLVALPRDRRVGGRREDGPGIARQWRGHARRDRAGCAAHIRHDPGGGSLTAYDRYLDNTIRRLEEVRATQGEAIAAAGRACADSIAAERLVFTFGTGHGGFAALETFPRTGTPVGFRPIVETPIALFHHVFGDMGS